MKMVCPFLRGGNANKVEAVVSECFIEEESGYTKKESINVCDCPLERCTLWNRESNECWVMTAVRDFVRINI